MWRSRIADSSRPLESPDAAQAQVPDVGLGGDEGHGHLVADLAAAQVGVHDHRELVRRAEARRALHRADDDRPRILDELLPALLRLDRVVDVADRTACARLRRPGLARESRRTRASGRSRSPDSRRRRCCRRRARSGSPPGARASPRRERNRSPCASSGAAMVELDVGALAPVHGYPGVARHELKARRVGDHRDLVVAPRELAHLVGHRHAAEAGPKYDDVCHDLSFPARRRWPRRWCVANSREAAMPATPRADRVLGELTPCRVHSQWGLWANTPSG